MFTPRYRKHSKLLLRHAQQYLRYKRGILQQVAEFILRGRNYINVVSQENDEVLQIQRKKYLFFFTWSQITFQHQRTRLVYCPPEQLGADFKVSPGMRYQRGEVIARGAVDTGDQVFV